MKQKVMVLTQDHLNMLRVLMGGYLSTRQKLMGLLESNTTPHKMITSTILLEPNPIGHTNPTSKNNKPGCNTKSDRFFIGPVTAEVIYASGRRIYARVRTLKDDCLVEPVDPNTALFLISRKDLDKGMVDLRLVDYIKLWHSKLSREFASYFR